MFGTSREVFLPPSQWTVLCDPSSSTLTVPNQCHTDLQPKGAQEWCINGWLYRPHCKGNRRNSVNCAHCCCTTVWMQCDTFHSYWMKRARNGAQRKFTCSLCFSLFYNCRMKKVTLKGFSLGNRTRLSVRTVKWLHISVYLVTFTLWFQKERYDWLSYLWFRSRRYETIMGLVVHSYMCFVEHILSSHYLGGVAGPTTTGSQITNWGLQGSQNALPKSWFSFLFQYKVDSYNWLPMVALSP